MLCITLGAVKAAWDMYGRLAMAAQGQQEAAAELADMEKEHARVSTSVQELSSSRGQEELVRERYGLVKPGEGVVQIVHNAPTSTPSNNGGGGFFGRLFHTLFSW